MTESSNSLSLFGLDLRRAGRVYRDAWHALLKGPAFAWLAPQLPVRVLRADGQLALSNGAHLSPADARSAASPFLAVEVDEELLLRRRLVLPDMPPDTIAQALQVEAASASPFPPDDLVWGHAVTGRARGRSQNIELALASRKQLERHLQQRLGSQPQPVQAVEAVEAWTFADNGQPIVLPGWGEGLRQRKAGRYLRWAGALAIGALILASAIAITPTLQLRARAIDALASFQALQRETAPIVAQREALTHAAERLQALHGILAAHADVLPLLATLSKVLPDSTYLQSVQIRGMKLSLHGLTADSAALMQTLGAVPGFADVRAPMAATRAPGANAENFRIELQLDPAVYSLAAQSPKAHARSTAAAAQGQLAHAAPSRMPGAL
ncbi:PilN domain-containing protein [Comamonas sp. NLF-1-9]|uniref:PilN domain-containing protein n=1 Tax=Comamonas sp. NLF-1-9 TaxID=2853163 RepID=UPI001C48410D|nr:PilN domain-containing protein [Comamonas sp. NLF-1-9]QXL83553.1 PilN domain-containing protein [Comamonas sp. NLF-1-9]